MKEYPEERLVERRVRYTYEHEGQVYLIEDVPARVNEETGERYFAPETVERLREIVKGQEQPSRTVETPVFEYASN